MPVDSNTHLVHLVADIRPGDTIDLKYYRDGKLTSTRVTVAKRTIEEAFAAPPRDLEGDKGRLGISGQNLTPQLAKMTTTDVQVLASVLVNAMIAIVEQVVELPRGESLEEVIGVADKQLKLILLGASIWDSTLERSR